MSKVEGGGGAGVLKALCNYFFIEASRAKDSFY